jgi:CheY-like chemotaxis protein
MLQNFSMARVLIIEDEPLLRRRIANILAADGHDVVEAENGKDGIERLQENGKPEVIVLDMVMPEMNGWGFLEFQRSNSNYSQIPVVVISAYEGIARSAKSNAYLPKPVETDDLLKAVNQFIA